MPLYGILFFTGIMFQITDINYKDDYIKVNIDTGDVFDLPGDILTMYPLSAGKIIDREEYLQLKEESERYNCSRKALNYLSIRSRSSFEMNNYLTKKGFSKDTVREIIEKLKDRNYINDYDYAMSFIDHKKKGKPAGKNLLKSGLIKKGISGEIIKKAINESGINKADPDVLYGIARKKLESLENKKNRIPKLIYFLKQRGFDHDEIRAVIKRLNLNDDENPPE